MVLGDIAHSRSGDKGNISNISVIVFHQKDYEILESYLTPKRVRNWFRDWVKGEVRRYDLPQLGAFNFVFYDALDGGVTQSLRIDKHGKCLSSHLLQMPLSQNQDSQAYNSQDS